MNDFLIAATTRSPSTEHRKAAWPPLLFVKSFVESFLAARPLPIEDGRLHSHHALLGVVIRQSQKALATPLLLPVAAWPSLFFFFFFRGDRACTVNPLHSSLLLELIEQGEDLLEVIEQGEDLHRVLKFKKKKKKK